MAATELPAYYIVRDSIKSELDDMEYTLPFKQPTLDTLVDEPS